MVDYYRLASCFADVGFTDAGLDLKPELTRKAKETFDKVHQPLVKARTDYEAKELPQALSKWLASRTTNISAPDLGNWSHIGPFAASSFDDAFEKAFPPESEIDLQKRYGNDKLKWTSQPKWSDGKVHNTLAGVNAANYLYREIETSVARKVSLSLGSDDAIKVWINGTEILSKKIARGAAADQEKVELPLKAGKNQLLMKIVNGGGGSGFYFKTNLNNPSKQVQAVLKKPRSEWNEKENKQVLDWYKTLDEQWLKLNAKVVQSEKNTPKPNLTKIYSAKNRGTTYNFGGNTYKVFHLRRGNPDNKQDEAAPGFLRVLMRSNNNDQHWLKSRDEKQFHLPQDRLSMAEWLTDTEYGSGALLARVIVNRLWHHHFGRGLVPTCNDFGIRGDLPTHPELLDWLASELVRNGWKLKPIHELILTSAVYMQSGAGSKSGLKQDAENLLLWRKPPTRLEAEIIRDALLSVSGSLDITMFGKGSLDERSDRRSIYLTVKRSRLIPLLQLFDAPDAMQGIGKRQESTVAPQALTLLNSPMIRGLAQKFAARVSNEKHPSIPHAIRSAYRIAFSREPSPAEQQVMEGFIEQQRKLREKQNNAEQLAFQDFCHLLFCMNEFVYID